MMPRTLKLGYALIVLTLLWGPGARAADPAQTHAAALTQAWSRTIADGTARAAAGDHEAPARLCRLYFDGHDDVLDPAKTVSWCRRAMEQGDAGAMREMGLLTLAGIGVSQDFDQAATLCAQAHSHDPAVSAGFCLAAVAAERQRAGEAPPPPETIASAAVDPALTATISYWIERSNHGDHAAPAKLCNIYFDAQGGTFDSVKAADWCRRAAEFGDARSMHRLGLMRFWGVGLERSIPQAEALCTEAQRRDPLVSDAFCVAAAKEERTRAALNTQPAHFAYPEPWPAGSDVTKFADALGPDRVLETMHTTATGLHYSCRDLIRWARYGLPLDSEAFDRPIVQYRAEDYTALEQAATDCATAIAPYDQDGSERRNLAKFRSSLPLLRQRSRQLAQATRQHQTELSQQVRVDRTLDKQHMVMVAALSRAEQQCTNAIYDVWAARPSSRANTLEIDSVTTSDVDGNKVVSGSARIIGTLSGEHASDNIYSCTFEGQSQRIVAKTLEAAVSSSLPVDPGH